MAGLGLGKVARASAPCAPLLQPALSDMLEGAGGGAGVEKPVVSIACAVLERGWMNEQQTRKHVSLVLRRSHGGIAQRRATPQCVPPKL